MQSSDVRVPIAKRPEGLLHERYFGMATEHRVILDEHRPCVQASAQELRNLQWPFASLFETLIDARHLWSKALESFRLTALRRVWNLFAGFCWPYGNASMGYGDRVGVCERPKSPATPWKKRNYNSPTRWSFDPHYAFFPNSLYGECKHSRWHLLCIIQHVAYTIEHVFWHVIHEEQMNERKPKDSQAHINTTP